MQPHRRVPPSRLWHRGHCPPAPAQAPSLSPLSTYTILTHCLLSGGPEARGSGLWSPLTVVPSSSRGGEQPQISRGGGHPPGDRQPTHLCPGGGQLEPWGHPGLAHATCIWWAHLAPPTQKTLGKRGRGQNEGGHRRKKAPGYLTLHLTSSQPTQRGLHPAQGLLPSFLTFLRNIQTNGTPARPVTWEFSH